MNVDQIATTAAAPVVPDFMDRRRAILARLDELRQDEGAAVLDGGTYDRKVIDKLKAELEALDAAEGEAARREHAARAADAAAQRADQSRKMIAAEAARLDAVDRAERAARDLCAALSEAREHAAEVHRLGTWLELPRALPVLDFDHRMSRRLSAVLRPVCAAGWKFGQIVLREPLLAEHGPWRDAEVAMMRNYLPKEDITHGN